MNAPVFILAPHRSFTTVTCAMLGRHPQLYGVPELNLMLTERLLGWWVNYRAGEAAGADGLLRAVAELLFGGQTEREVELARRWLRRRLNWESAAVFEALAEQVHPRAVVEKSPLNSTPAVLERLARSFPDARYIHLTRHPRPRAESVLTAMPRVGLDPGMVDPSGRWFEVNANIIEFLGRLREEQWLRVQGEELMADPGSGLRRLAEWLGLRTDDQAVDAMLHPETSPFARLGPPSARLGNDVEFLERPELRPWHRPAASLDGPLSWSEDGAGFPARVKELAQELGYS
jgi:hypothetical protein